MTQKPDDNEELRKAVAEAEAAEAALRKRKEGLIPTDRVDALNELMRAELSALMYREVRRFSAEIVAAATYEESLAVTTRMTEAMSAGVKRLEVEMRAQARAWTLAGMEDRARSDP